MSARSVTSEYLSKIQDEIAFGGCRAQQHGAVGGLFQRRLVVGGRSLDHGGRAGVADAAPARVPGGHVARFGEFQEGMEAGRPGDAEPAAGERDLAAPSPVRPREDAVAWAAARRQLPD